MSEYVFTRLARAATVSALALTASLGASGVAGAASPEDHPIEVSIGASGLQAPDSAKGGLVSFRVKTDDPNGRQLQLLRPHDGVTPEQVYQDLAKAVSSAPHTAAQGIRAVNQEADLLGGALVTPQVHEQFTEEIAPGPVYLLDLTALRDDPAHPVAKLLTLAGTNGQSANQARFDDGIVIEHDQRFQTEDVDHAHLAYLVHDASDQIHEMELRPIGADTTEEQIGQYLRNVQLGRPAQSPFTGPATGLGALSSDHTASVQAHGLQPGRYVLLCMVPDERTGVPHAVLGMHTIVTLQ
ncbi:hypothetical protein OG500_34175 [Kitasatospora sp. NBC_01250]|uniref:hypothetical protein n=1 Tax=unclassified Kitasatospora TaxID=2633591 RepID=UPI002E142C75|nr:MULTISPECIES: hypothetical protein [unclassified Kitasatospora]WSJ71013.1 hypothetical protein OG294_35720 [Kitasatospora sp. NBC_01302]